jgi:hypothetical protein
MFRVRWGNKFGNQKSEHNGILYHSKKEAGYAAELDLRLKSGDVANWERQVRVSLDVNGYHICDYYVDFLVYYPDGTKEYVEVKGFETDLWRMKWKLFEALYSKMPGFRDPVIVK